MKIAADPSRGNVLCNTQWPLLQVRPRRLSRWWNLYQGGSTFRGERMWRQNKKSKPTLNHEIFKEIFLLSCLKVCGCLHEERHRAGTTLFKSIGEQTKRKYEDRFLLPGDQNPDHRQGSLSTRPLSRGRLPYTGLTTTLTTSSTVDNNIDHLRHIVEWSPCTAHIHHFAGVCCQPRSSIRTPPKFPSCDSEPSAQPHHRSGPGGRR